MHRMTVWAERFATGLNQRSQILLKFEFNNPRSDPSGNHQNLIRSQIAKRLLEPGIRLQNVSQPSATALSRGQLLIGQRFRLDRFGLLATLVELFDQGRYC
jgi:hypothetical protein